MALEMGFKLFGFLPQKKSGLVISTLLNFYSVGMVPRASTKNPPEISGHLSPSAPPSPRSPVRPVNVPMVPILSMCFSCRECLAFFQAEKSWHGI